MEVYGLVCVRKRTVFISFLPRYHKVSNHIKDHLYVADLQIYNFITSEDIMTVRFVQLMPLWL